MTDSSAPVGFLDSGIGGITVLKKSIDLLQNEDFFFFSDSKNNPYGDKSDSEIIGRCSEIVSYMADIKGCKAVVIACNTASAKASKALRGAFPDIPIVAIEPAYKMVHDEAPEGRTLVMATKGTITSEKFRRLYYAYYDHNTSIHSCVGLAELIEEGNSEKIIRWLKDNLGNYSGKVENVVLGCTHYPLIKKELRAVLGNVRFFDGAEGVSRRLKSVLVQKNLLSHKKEKGYVEFYDSSADEHSRKNKEKRFFTILSA